jgi:hypothetical protein
VLFYANIKNKSKMKVPRGEKSVYKTRRVETGEDRSSSPEPVPTAAQLIANKEFIDAHKSQPKLEDEYAVRGGESRDREVMSNQARVKVTRCESIIIPLRNQVVGYMRQLDAYLRQHFGSFSQSPLTSSDLPETIRSWANWIYKQQHQLTAFMDHMTAVREILSDPSTTYEMVVKEHTILHINSPGSFATNFDAHINELREKLELYPVDPWVRNEMENYGFQYQSRQQSLARNNEIRKRMYRGNNKMMFDDDDASQDVPCSVSGSMQRHDGSMQRQNAFECSPPNCTAVEYD